jgi:hypothetical protein
MGEAYDMTNVLFVIDNDFGALGTVMYLLHGQPLAQRSTLLLPSSAHAFHGALGVASRPYASLDDIVRVVEAQSPDVVLLYSGYLLASQGLLAIREVRSLVGELRRRGCAVATSDPFLGTYRRVAQAKVPCAPGGILEAVAGLWPNGAARLHALRVRRHVHEVAGLMEDVTHLYPVPVPPLEAPGGAPRLSFFNPRYFGQPRAAAREWLFVLAKFDFEYQQAAHGKQRFVELVAAKLREALSQGRRATFIGPAAAVEALGAHLGADPGITLLQGCAFVEFERRLLEAEAAFYWQVFSTSTFLRLWNGLPVFFFDPGHASRLLRPMYEAGIASDYMGRAPAMLDIAQPLDAGALMARSGEFADIAGAALTRLKALPEPEEAIEEIVRSA